MAIAIKTEAKKCIEYLLTTNALILLPSELSEIDERETAPLIYACELSNLNMVNYFLSKGYDSNEKDQAGLTALEVAFENLSDCSLELIQLLLAHRADLKACGSSCIFKAAHIGNMSLIKRCFDELNSPKFAVDEHGRTVWQIAQLNNNQEVLEYIRKKAIEDAAIEDRICMICCDDAIDSATLLTPCYGCLALVCSNCIRELPRCQKCKRDF